jgi:hypothetical protein
VACGIVAGFCGSTAAQAPATPPAAAPGAAAGTTAPAQTPSTPAATEAPAPETAPPAGEAAAPAEATVEDDAVRRRARIAAVIARGRAQRAAAAARVEGPAKEREPEQVHGDAGAAFALGLSVEAPWYTDPGYDVFAEDDVARRPGVWLGYDIVSLRTDTIAALELGWGTESEEETGISNAVETSLESHAFHGGVQVRWVPFDFLQPHVRLAGGVSVVHAELATHSPAQTFEDDGILPFGSAGLGVMLRTPTRLFEDRKGQLASLSFGLLVEGGYTLSAPLSLKLDGRGPRDRDIALAEADLGELDRSGPYLRFSLVGRM